MLVTIALIQFFVFGFFFTLERLYPDRSFPVPHHFTFWWMALGIFALLWLRAIFYLWLDTPSAIGVKLDLPIVLQGFIFYLFYSFGNYWFHRAKHANRWLWRYVHHLHHSTSHMESRIAFYRHPIEIALNTVYIVLLGKVGFDMPVEAIAIALAIEGCLECFHHANIHFPRRFLWLGYIVQLPGMHLVHHEYGYHQKNYAPFLWDTVFGTVQLAPNWRGKLGFAQSHDISASFFFKPSKSP